MTKHTLKSATTPFLQFRNGSLAVDPLTSSLSKTLDQVRDDERLKTALKRSVNKIAAPQYLIDSIRAQIRR
jgi:hypothetical protein